MIKKCNACNGEKLVKHFPKNSKCSNGRSPYCRACWDLAKQNYQINPMSEETKECMRCGEHKALEKFRLRVVNPDTFTATFYSMCRDCEALDTRTRVYRTTTTRANHRANVRINNAVIRGANFDALIAILNHKRIK